MIRYLDRPLPLVTAVLLSPIAAIAVVRLISLQWDIDTGSVLEALSQGYESILVPLLSFLPSLVRLELPAWYYDLVTISSILTGIIVRSTSVSDSEEKRYLASLGVRQSALDRLVDFLIRVVVYVACVYFLIGVIAFIPNLWMQFVSARMQFEPFFKENYTEDQRDMALWSFENQKRGAAFFFFFVLLTILEVLYGLLEGRFA